MIFLKVQDDNIGNFASNLTVELYSFLSFSDLSDSFKDNLVSFSGLNAIKAEVNEERTPIG